MTIEVRSGCEKNLISKSMAEMLSLEVLIDAIMINEHINETYLLMHIVSLDDIVGITHFSLHRSGLELQFD